MRTFFLIVILTLSLGGSMFAQSPWQSVSAASVTLEYRTAAGGQNLECKVIGQSSGWVAVGFNQTNVMQNANFIIGYVSGGTGHIRDDFGTGSTSHASDVSLGGTDDVSLIQATETGGMTTLHFSIPLSTGDQYDRPLTVGSTYPIILARGESNTDNYTGMHAGAGFASISLLAPVANEDNNMGVPVPSHIIGNYPNPFNPSTSIRYYLDKNTPVQFSIFNSRGQLVYQSQQETKDQGNAVFNWDGRNNSGAICPSGRYTVKLNTPSGSDRLRIILSK